MINPCSNLSRLDRAERLSHHIWGADIGKKLKAGKCRLCGQEMAIAYQIIQDGELSEIKSNDIQGIAHAQAMQEKGSNFVYPVTICEVMTDPDLYYEAERFCRSRKAQKEEHESTKKWNLGGTN